MARGQNGCFAREPFQKTCKPLSIPKFEFLSFSNLQWQGNYDIKITTKSSTWLFLNIHKQKITPTNFEFELDLVNSPFKQIITFYKYYVHLHDVLARVDKTFLIC